MAKVFILTAAQASYIASCIEIGMDDELEGEAKEEGYRNAAISVRDALSWNDADIQLTFDTHENEVEVDDGGIEPTLEEILPHAGFDPIEPG